MSSLIHRSIHALFGLTILAACQGEMGGGGEPETAATTTPPPPPTPSGTGGSSLGGDPFGDLPTGVEQWKLLCAKGYNDDISAAFCAGASPPSVTSITELQALVGLALVPGASTNPKTALLGHSTAVTGRTVSTINPRAFVLTPPLSSGAPNPSYVVLAYSRGEMMVELAAKDLTSGEPRFYLFVFEHSCSQASGGCTNGDLFTPTIESQWTDYTIYDDYTIRNTTMDCLRCHEPGGPGTGKMLRMQELNKYWMHWVFSEQGQVLSDNYTSFHDNSEGYAGIPPSVLYLPQNHPYAAGSIAAYPGPLESLVRNNGFGSQPNDFDTPTIRAELQSSGHSATWDGLYALAVAGDAIPPPHYTDDVTDPAKVSAMRTAYQGVMGGSLPGNQLPDLREVFLDSILAEISVRPKPGLDGRGIMQHICQQCHNSHLDQTISRATFNVETLDQLPQVIKDLAIARLQLPESDPKRMPPPRFHVLSDAERQLVIDELTP